MAVCLKVGEYSVKRDNRLALYLKATKANIVAVCLNVKIYSPKREYGKKK